MTDIEFVHESTATLYKTDASDLDVCRAAWVSHDTGAHEKEAEPGKVEGLISYLYRNRHMSPFEHSHFTFIIDTPLFVRSQIMRHRTSAFNETSARYSELRPRFYVPPADRPLQQGGKIGAYTFTPGTATQAGAVNGLLRGQAQAAWETYQYLLRDGVAKEVARTVLPQNTMTTFWMTLNARNLMGFLDLRADEHAQWETQQVARQMQAAFEEAMPLTAKAWKAGR